ncbi:MAG: signal peptide peptidase SppA [Oligoflexales bacterium]
MAHQSFPYRFFKKTLKMIRYSIMTLGFCCLFLMFGLFKLASTGFENPPATPPDHMILKLKISGPVLASQQQGFFDTFLHMNPSKNLWIPKLRSQILQVINDEQVKGLFITLENVQGSFAQMEEIHNLLRMVKDAGKPVHIWSATFDTKSYLLASATSHIIMPFIGQIQLTDPAIQLTYFGSALKKIGIGINVVRAGQYKSAFEAWTHDKPSTESRTAYQALEKSIRIALINLTAQGREKPIPTVQTWFSESLYTAEEAQAQSIVDQLNYEEASLTSMEEAYQAERYSWHDYHRTENTLTSLASSTATSAPGIAWIEAVGPISMTASGQQGSNITPKMKQELDWARNDESIKAVVLRIDSPGGSAIASELIWKSIEELNQIKPVVISMGGVAASGGYYLSAPASKIFASATTITGSIGVIGMIPWLQDSKQHYGISFHTITSGKRESLLNPGQTLSRADREKIQASVTSTYDLFLDRVSAGRSMDKTKAHNLAQGRVWTGSQALEHGLIDHIGGTHEALIEAKILAQWQADDKVPLRRWSPNFQNLSDCLNEASNPMQCFPLNNSPSQTSLFEHIQNSIEWFEKIQKEHLQARLPFLYL